MKATGPRVLSGPHLTGGNSGPGARATGAGHRDAARSPGHLPAQCWRNKLGLPHTPVSALFTYSEPCRRFPASVRRATLLGRWRVSVSTIVCADQAEGGGWRPMVDGGRETGLHPVPSPGSWATGRQTWLFCSRGLGSGTEVWTSWGAPRCPY